MIALMRFPCVAARWLLGNGTSAVHLDADEAHHFVDMLVLTLRGRVLDSVHENSIVAAPPGAQPPAGTQRLRTLIAGGKRGQDP